MCDHKQRTILNIGCKKRYEINIDLDFFHLIMIERVKIGFIIMR